MATNVLTLPTALVDLTHRAPQTVSAATTPRNDYQTELVIALTRLELAVGVGSMIGGLVGLGIGATAGCIVGAAPAGAVGAIVGGAALGIPVGIYSWVRLNNTLTNSSASAA